MDILNSWQAVAVLTVLTLSIVAGLVWIGKLRKDAQGQVEDNSQAIYQSLKDAYERGQMDEAEFERIRASLGAPPDRWPDLKKIRATPATPTSPPPAPDQAEA